jgi:hypothetical protein
MTRRLCAALLVVMAVAFVPIHSAAQTSRSKDAAAQWKQPRTPWGDPDIQGIWNNVTLTPLERPAEFKDKATLTPREAADYERRVASRQAENEATPVQEQSRGSRVGYSPTIWFETGHKLTDYRTSMLLKPEDGKLPPLTPEAQKIAAALAERRKQSPADIPEDLGTYTRCITRGLPGGMMPGFYNHNYEIVQTQGYIAIMVEMIHDLRIIPMGERPHAPAAVKQWLGDSRGRWDGSSLVVETTNLRDVEGRSAGGFGTTERGRVIERFTRLGPDTMDYQVTVDDPGWYTAPWTASIPMTKVKGPLYEYACHEGNYALPGILAGERRQERQKAAQQQ